MTTTKELLDDVPTWDESKLPQFHGMAHGWDTHLRAVRHHDLTPPQEPQSFDWVAKIFCGDWTCERQIKYVTIAMAQRVVENMARAITVACGQHMDAKRPAAP